MIDLLWDTNLFSVTHTNIHTQSWVAFLLNHYCCSLLTHFNISWVLSFRLPVGGIYALHCTSTHNMHINLHAQSPNGCACTLTSVTGMKREASFCLCCCVAQTYSAPQVKGWILLFFASVCAWVLQICVCLSDYMCIMLLFIFVCNWLRVCLLVCWREFLQPTAPFCVFLTTVTTCWEKILGNI